MALAALLGSTILATVSCVALAEYSPSAVVVMAGMIASSVAVE